MIARCTVVDLGGRDAGDRRRARVQGDAIAQACAADGYFALTGHGIAEDVLERARAESLRFFARPHAEKMRALANELFGGYVPPLPEDDPRLVSLPKEAFNAVEGDMDEVWCRCPQSFVEATMHCRGALADLAVDLLDGIASVGAGYFTPDAWNGLDGDGPSVFRAVLYPALGSHDHWFPDRCEPHTDLGLLTILDSSFDAATFQVAGEDGRWQDVMPPPGSLLINIGDDFERRTAGVWRAPRHRVATPRTAIRKRLSLIYFHNPNSCRSAVESYLRSSAIAMQGGTR